MKLKEVLLSIDQEANHEIPNLNWGGCALFAYLVGKELMKRDIKFKYRIEDPVFNKNLKFINCSHMWIECRGLHINYCGDCDSELVDPKYFINNLKSTLNQNRKEDNYNWNSNYNRENDKKLKQIIRKYFNKLK